MSTARELHNKAMALLQDAIIYRQAGEDCAAEDIYKDAFIAEKKAADLVAKKENCEPTRSILYASAASLAYQAKEYKQSLNCIHKCLNGKPSAKIFKETTTLYKEVVFKLYLTQELT